MTITRESAYYFMIDQSRLALIGLPVKREENSSGLPAATRIFWYRRRYFKIGSKPTLISRFGHSFVMKSHLMQITTDWTRREKGRGINVAFLVWCAWRWRS